MANNFSARLARIEAALEAEQAAAELLRAERLVDFVETHPPGTQASFWRAARSFIKDTDTSPVSLALCGGTYEVTDDDFATYQRVAGAYWGPADAQS